MVIVISLVREYIDFDGSEINVKLAPSLCLNVQYLRSSLIEIALSLNETNSAE